jgi:hypothetical protein
LSREETDAAFHRCVPYSVSGTRLAAAVLDVHGHPMTEAEILAAIPATPPYHPPKPKESPNKATKGLVLREADGRLALNRASPEVVGMRSRIRAMALPVLRRAREDAYYRARIAERQREEAARLAANPPAPPPPSKLAWEGTLVSVQPRIRLLRSFDQRSHSYLGYLLRVRGEVGGMAKEFVVAIGQAAQAKHEFRVGDVVHGEGAPVANPGLETADLYKASRLKATVRGRAERSRELPCTGVPPSLEEYRQRGHRRLAALTYAAKCVGCLWGCEMAVEIVIDPWKPSKPRTRRETFCYGPKSCPHYAAGPPRKVPGRKGMSWTEEDWVDEEATSHRAPEE